MNVNDTNKIISALQSFADRLKADPVAGTVYEGDWDTLFDSQAMLRQQQALTDGADVIIKELQDRLGKKMAEIEALKEEIKDKRTKNILRSLGHE